MTLWWIYLFALQIAISYSRLYSVCEVWFVLTCHSRQQNLCVLSPLRSCSDLIFALYSKFCPSAWTLEMARTENLCLLSTPHQQLLSAPRLHLLYIILSVSALHHNPKVLPPNSIRDLRPLTESTVLLITFFSGCKICQ